MHIKSLKIQGFKSYRDETIVDPFSSGLNLLVGRNGSGKSNFFAAIRFVLSDAYTSLSREERQTLLHDGSNGGAGGGATMSAFVEVEFNNADGRFPTNKPTLLLRRTIGLKKDEYQLDRKSTSKGEVMSLLESAGFSRSNPYYIVPQGRITHLTNQKDSDRLALLKEVAGTRVYEERRAESMKIMDETNLKKGKIADLLQFIAARLDELKQEKEELAEFQTQDRQRRSLEYAIYQRELKDVAEALEQIEEERRRDVDSANTRREETNEREKAAAELEATLTATRQRLEILRIEHREASDERSDLTKSQAQVECIVRDAEDATRKFQRNWHMSSHVCPTDSSTGTYADRGEERLHELEQELEHVEASINEAETELMEVSPQFEDLSRSEASTRQALETAQTTLGVLHAKEGRRNQFRTQAERDRHLKALVEGHGKAIEERERGAQSLEQDLEKAREALGGIQEGSAEIRKELDGRKEAIREMQSRLAQHKVAQAEAVEKRKDIWKEDAKLDSQLRHAMEQLKTAQRNLSATVDRDTARGLASARAIAERLGLQGYHGALFELFTVEDRYKVAVEVTAGTSLFQIVVDDDDTATQILDVMIKEKSGRITFMPLNRLHPQQMEYPEGNEAVPIIDRLTFDAQYRPAFQQVFGKTLVCKSLEVAGRYARGQGFNSITLDGDKYDRKGSLTGGYHDQRRSRLDAVKNLKEWEGKVDRLSEEREEIKRTITRLDQEVTQLVGQIQVVEGRLARTHEEREPMVMAMMTAQTDEERQRARIQKFEATLTTLRADARNLTQERDAYQQELGTPMVQSLTSQEQAQVAQLNIEVDRQKKELARLSETLADVAGRKNLLEIDLSENLRRRREELRSRIEAFGTGGEAKDVQEGTGEDVEARKRQLKALGKQIEELTSKLDGEKGVHGDSSTCETQLETETESLNAQVASLEKEREKKEAQHADDQRTIARQQKNVERYLHKRQILLQRKDECNKKIRDLGVLPEEAFVETTVTSEKLLKRLRKVNEALKAFSHVNKKAFEQFTSFTKQQADLTSRQEELDESAKSITDLIDTLDARKDQAIDRTFKQVADNFREVFEKLVPAGKGELIMQRREGVRGDDEMEVDEDEDDAEDGAAVENFIGVTIRVSFNSKTNEGLKIQQLSGGQKALVALAMSESEQVFAIQKCDPAPFYLFDEIDANLDADRRTGVAAMIGELSQTGQYICTTFRPELIPHADAYFGVIFNATKISNVKKLTADQCGEFIEAAEQVRA
ncbi:BQ2448_3817 [Microbotryum intermedium]|uniref:Structural maintenance of chromosomes protein n=1 Tax=Microbotryum intermedium TaxID=269621 RepID=A0A238FCZ0_9BASI|nr:BQ2448_3817 [Microbotryum intermedium]